MSEVHDPTKDHTMLENKVLCQGFNSTNSTPFVMKLDRDRTWRVGSTHVCERLDGFHPMPEDVLVSWSDHDDVMILRECGEKVSSGDGLDPLFPQEAKLAGFRVKDRATYSIGNEAFCKVVTRTNGQTEVEAIDILRKLEPSIPLPEIIYAWTDNTNSYTLIKRVEGTTLRAAWHFMSVLEQQSLVNEVAAIIHTLAQHTSTHEELLNGTGIPEVDEGPLVHRNSEEARAYYGETLPDSGAPFPLFHVSLSPSNIFVKNGRLVAITGWDRLRYFPRWYIATTIYMGPWHHFQPPLYDGLDNLAWQSDLADHLITHYGYPAHVMEYINWWNERAERMAIEDIKKEEETKAREAAKKDPVSN